MDQNTISRIFEQTAYVRTGGSAEELRCAQYIQAECAKFGGNLGASGCVSWSFDKKGVLVIDNSEGELDEEEVMMDAMDAGADDFEADGDVFTIYTLPDDFNSVVENLSKYTFVSAQIEMVPQNYQKLESEEHIKLMEKLIDIMEEDDDVQNIWHNWEE